MLGFEYFDAAGTAVVDGVYIPVADLPGTTAAELAAAATGKESKVVLSLLNKMYTTIAPTSFPALGFAVTKPNPVGSGNDLVSQTYGMTIQQVVNHGDNTLNFLPVPTTGTNNGLGDFAVVDVFPGATKIAAAGAIAGAGILIPTGALDDYGAPTHASLTITAGQDNRSWFAALMQYMVDAADLRSTTLASGIITKTRGNAAGQAPTAAFTQATNPTTGIDAADLSKRSFFSVAYSIALQLILNQATQTFDINSVTS